MPDQQPLFDAIRRYFDLMYSGDVSRFDEVFYPSFQMHGFIEGEMRCATAERYREVMAAQPSPHSLNAARDDAVQLVDFASDTQALAKVQVRINRTIYIDYLIFHYVDGEWRVTSKAYHTLTTDADGAGT